MNRFLKMTSLAALCALLAVPAGAGAALTSALTLARPKSASTLTPKYSAISGSIRISGQESPFSHLLTAHAELRGERVLRETLFAPQRGDRRSDNVLFHCMNLQKAFYPDEPRIGAPG